MSEHRRLTDEELAMPEYVRGYADALFETVNDLVKERVALQSQVDALRADAERYRWLRDVADRDDEMPHISVEFEEADSEDGEEEYFTSLHHRWLTGERADKAIDAARSPATSGDGP